MPMMLMVALFTSSPRERCRCCCEALAPLPSSTTTKAAQHQRAAARTWRSLAGSRSAGSRVPASHPPSFYTSSLGPLILGLARPESEGGEDSNIDVDSSSASDRVVEAENDDDNNEVGQAATRTVNQRLLDELREAAEREASSSALASTSSSKKKNKRSSISNLFSGMSSGKTDEERQAAIEEARDLNGINPVVAIAGSAFALAVAAALWTLTNAVAESFATHPVESDLYAVQRATAVFRNVIMGLFALASGFFGVTGVGILLLGVRVAVGIAKGELDPTPLPPSPGRSGGGPERDGNGSGDEANDRAKVLSNAWELMTGGGQSGRRRRPRRYAGDKDDTQE